jgi:hypothetical protein
MVMRTIFSQLDTFIKERLASFPPSPDALPYLMGFSRESHQRNPPGRELQQTKILMVGAHEIKRRIKT